LWLPDTSAEQGLEVAERVRAAVERTPALWQGRPAPVTCSIGVAALGSTVTDLANLYPAADAALYRAKQAGRNRVAVAEGRNAARTA
jgi:diguanylate cyclase (GGDEF)-like protein